MARFTKKAVKDYTSDYQNFTNINMPTKERRALGVGDIWANQGMCLKCKTVIRSKNRHDYVTCKCGAVSVDGGSWYLRRAGNLKDFKDMSIMYRYVKKNS